MDHGIAQPGHLAKAIGGVVFHIALFGQCLDGLDR
jgi:hypothetical protein